MKKRIVNALLAGFLLVSATACGKQPAADAAQPVADPTQAYFDTVDVDYAYDLALKLEDIRSNETLGYRTAGSDAELATGDMLKVENGAHRTAKRHEGCVHAGYAGFAVWLEPMVYPFLGFPRTPFLSVAENLPLYRQPQCRCSCEQRH